MTPVRLLDRALRRAGHIHEYSDDAACLFRYRVITAPNPFLLGGETIPSGAPLLEIHLWNERVPPIPMKGPDLGWGKRFQHAIVDGLRHLAAHVETQPQLLEARAVGGTTLVFSYNRGIGAGRALARHGFLTVEIPPRRAPFELGERILCWLLAREFQDVAPPLREFLQTPRSQSWVPMGDFRRRYGATTREAVRTQSPHSGVNG